MKIKFERMKFERMVDVNGRGERRGKKSRTAKTRKSLENDTIPMSSAVVVSSQYVRKQNMELHMVVPEYALPELSGSQVSIKDLFSDNRVPSSCLMVVHYRSIKKR